MTTNDWMIIAVALIVVLSLRSAIKYQNKLEQLIEYEELEHERLKKQLAEAEEQLK